MTRATYVQVIVLLGNGMSPLRDLVFCSKDWTDSTCSLGPLWCSQFIIIWRPCCSQLNYSNAKGNEQLQRKRKTEPFSPPPTLSQLVALHTSSKAALKQLPALTSAQKQLQTPSLCIPQVGIIRCQHMDELEAEFQHWVWTNLIALHTSNEQNSTICCETGGNEWFV